jgi:dihydrofolate reductase
MITAIFAIDDDFGIGDQGSIPWPNNKEDMRWFRDVTTSQIVVMGRKTWDSPDMPKPLPGRHNVVFTNQMIVSEGITQIKGNVCEGIQYLHKQYPENDIFVIGGADLLMQAKPVIECVFVTRIPGSYFCDTTIDFEEFITGFRLLKTRDLGTCIVETYETIS